MGTELSREDIERQFEMLVGAYGVDRMLRLAAKRLHDSGVLNKSVLEFCQELSGALDLLGLSAAEYAEALAPLAMLDILWPNSPMYHQLTTKGVFGVGLRLCTLHKIDREMSGLRLVRNTHSDDLRQIVIGGGLIVAQYALDPLEFHVKSRAFKSRGIPVDWIVTLYAGALSVYEAGAPDQALPLEEAIQRRAARSKAS